VSGPPRALGGTTERLAPSSSVAEPVHLAVRTEDPRRWSDSELVVLEGPRRAEAYAELFRRHARSVEAATRLILHDAAACEDVVNDVFLSLWSAPTRFDPDRGSLQSYLRMCARGRSIDFLRCEANRSRREQTHGIRREIESDDVESSMLALESASEMRRAVAALPAGEREAIDLAYFHGMTYAAVALRLQIAEGTAKSRIRRGLQRLQESAEVRNRLLVARPGRRPSRGVPPALEPM
jgi:RNA polymerase sigma-70 factor (ECF subfamily)